ncbi:DUF2950 domain-containing protein [Paraburkholderia rhizosphaerae]|uniref:DUF2950 family protein n=1 Tax=Paraburkholderia rhizosphaerae TaxID=480658 RepID=A0A4R8LKR0_9BURK|nr:DUF2950 domain-containing protein [Paraburkholderia rhizosphaerae]TDY45143.1 Protein of unknown function (DUF2950) [Paraburkholderia rhizosphaerae]
MTRYPVSHAARLTCLAQRAAHTAAHRAASYIVRGAAGTLVAAATLLCGIPGAHAQAVYPTADAAANAFVNALATNDHMAMKRVLGSHYPRFIPTTEIGQDDIYAFLGQWAKGHAIVEDATPRNGRPSAHLEVGDDGWTLPIPIEKVAGGWRFNTPAATDEMLTRRIGRNERAAILTSLAYVDAQNDYRNLTQHYAQKFISTPKQHDGLYWDTAPGEPQSPLGPLAATMQRRIAPGEAYHGYHFRILTAQGSHANGGPQSYMQDGVLKKGFALVAWPAEYGKTGVMSFIVNQDGQVYQKDLGPRTASAVDAIRSFDPDSSWQPAHP